MILAFVLSMPNNNAWNGKWSGDNEFYAIVKNIGKSKKAEAKGKNLANRTFYYSFGDGWTARVTVGEVNAKEAAQARRKSRGFWGYNWMVDSILLDGQIIAPSDRV